jgi:hypothetical protein
MCCFCPFPPASARLYDCSQQGVDAAGGCCPHFPQPVGKAMSKGRIWTIVGILLIVALIIWITRAV